MWLGHGPARPCDAATPHDPHDSSHRRALMLMAALACALPGVLRSQTRRLVLATGVRPPMIGAGGRPGFIEEVAREALRRIGLGLEVVALPIERALRNADAGIEDGDLYRTPGFEQAYPNLVQVPEVLIMQDFVAFTLRPDIEIPDWAALDRYEIAFINGQKIVERKLAGRPGVSTVRDGALLFGLLRRARVDLVLHNRWVGLAQARRAGLAVRVLNPPLLRVPMFIYLHRDHQPLVPTLAAAIAQLKADGTWQRYYDQILAPLEKVQ